MAMRACTAFSTVLYMKMGRSLEEAGRAALQDLGHLVDPYAGRVSLVAVDAQGRHAAFSTGPETTYIYMTEAMETHVEAPRIHVPVSNTQGG
jgi:isoaspartyl peptidase/L-asparaginase-like protein (Ntn-hydrolase superfamily)